MMMDGAAEVSVFWSFVEAGVWDDCKHFQSNSMSH